MPQLPYGHQPQLRPIPSVLKRYRVLSNLRLPILSLGLKEVSGYLGFRASTDVTSALDAIMLYIPREPSGVYPHWFVVRVRYAGLASPWHATGAGYVLFAQAAKGVGW